MFAIGLENGYIFSKEKNAYYIVRDENVVGSISMNNGNFHIEADDQIEWFVDEQYLILDKLDSFGKEDTIVVTGNKENIKHITKIWNYLFPRGMNIEFNANGMFRRETDKYSLTVISETEVHVTLSREWMHDH